MCVWTIFGIPFVMRTKLTAEETPLTNQSHYHLNISRCDAGCVKTS